MPKRTKHITKPQNPIGWVKGGKIKTLDNDTGKVSWKSIKRGLALDIQGGEPTSAVLNRKDAKIPHSHKVHVGRKTHTTRSSDE